MNDSQNNAFIADQTASYVDAYTPPDGDGATDDNSTVTFSPPIDAAASNPSSSGDGSMTPPVSNPQGGDLSDTATSDLTESLEEQNIFAMLGVENGTEAQKESFLDELQQVIWEDFLEHDVELLISSEEYTQLQTMVKDRPTVDLEQQEKIVVFLEKIIPDLEDIMLEKALQLKGDMFRERIAGMREFYVDKPEALAAIVQAEQLMNQSKWESASKLLNSLQS